MTLLHLFVGLVTFMHVTLAMLSAYAWMEGKATPASTVLAGICAASVIVGAIAWVGLR